MLIQLAALECRLRDTQVLSLPQGFVLSRGEHWCIYGGNGSGKTALVQLLLGRLPRYRGALSFADGFDPEHDVCEVSFEEQQRLCALDDRFDISEFSADARDVGTRVENLVCDTTLEQADAARLEEILSRLDIQDIRRQGIRFLSSGQMRRAMIARALYLQPALLVLDNPLESIDRHSAERIQQALESWMSPANATLLLCRRIQQLPARMTHMLIMQDLQILEQGDYNALRDSVVKRAQQAARWQCPPQLPARCAGRAPPEAGSDALSDARSDALSEDALPESGSSQALVSLRGVSAAYGEQRIFEDLQFDMWPGDHVLLEGPNGSGKSTLLALIDGDNHKAYGQPVFLFGRQRGSGESVWDIKARFGIVSNDLHNRYIKGWRVLEVVVSGFFDSLGLYDDSGASEASCAREWLALLGLAGLEREYYHTLSFGQQRLVLLARAMVKHPRILVLDEPCVGLDDYHSQLLLDAVDFIAAQGQTQILFVSHSSDDIPRCINTHIVFRLSHDPQQPRSLISIHRNAHR